MATKTLLDRAKSRREYRKPRSKLPEKQLEDLAIAYMTDEVGYMAAAEALKQKGNGVYGILASSFKRAVAKGRIKLTKV
jgi:hypothetical protein